MRHQWFLLTALCVSATLHAATRTVIRPVIDSTATVTFVPDSTLQTREIVIHTDSADRRGHYVQAHLGFGYGSLGYSLDGELNETKGSFGGLLQLQYAYFFHPYWGIGAGLWFTNYTTYARLGGSYTWKDQTDSDMEQHYDHTATILRWSERETIHNIGIPVSLQFQYLKKNWKAGFYAALGVAPSFSVGRTYRLLEGEVAHEGYYPAWDLRLKDTHEFGTKSYTGEPWAKGPLSIRMQFHIFAEIGTLIPLSKQIDLYLGGFCNLSMNDAAPSDKKNLGWQDADFTFMDSYSGVYATRLAGASRPWEAGLKVGIHWRHIRPDRRKTEEYYEPTLVEKTVYEYYERMDTVVIYEAEEVEEVNVEAKAEVKLPKFEKVFFEFNSYQLSEKAQNYLLYLVRLFTEEPEYKLSVEGHASKEGNPAYNKRLADNRAKAVADFMTGHGIDGKRITVIGYGSKRPNEENIEKTPEADRRVEINVTKDTNEQ